MRTTPCDGTNPKAVATALRSSLGNLAAAALLAMVAGCGAIRLENPWDRYYDLNWGVEKTDISDHFNLHRGRWWNYYARGSLYLAYGYYQDAFRDFNEAAQMRYRDVRDARTYGMHFIDYFPHRESGIALCLCGEAQGTPDDERVGLFRQAIAELEESLGHEESARAKFYLNRARRGRWRAAGEDETAPVIRVKKPVYVNRRTAKFDFTASDKDSLVGDIQISSSRGSVDIHGASPFIELAQEEIKETVELTIRSPGVMAVVVITATDLAGNTCDPNSTLVILDAEAPRATLALLGETDQPGDDVEVYVHVSDDFGLSHIQVGADASHRVNCNGAPMYWDTMVGTPEAGELVVRAVDVAGNTMIASVPLQDDAAPATQEPWQKAALRFAPATLADAGALHHPLFARHVFAPVVRASHGTEAGYVRTTFLAQSVDTLTDERRRPGRPTLRFERHVLPPANETAKEITADRFRVEGMLEDRYGMVKLFTVDGEEVELSPASSPEEWRDRLRDEDLLRYFRKDVVLPETWVDREREIEVKAYRDVDPNRDVGPNKYQCLVTKTVRVVRKSDPRLEPNSVCGLLLLPLHLRREQAAVLRPMWATSRLERAYRTLRDQLKAQRIRELDSARFNVYDVNDVYRVPTAAAWFRLDKDPGTVVGELQSWRVPERRRRSRFIRPGPRVDPNLIDLVVYGEIKLYSAPEEEEECGVELRAIDVLFGEELRFPAGKDDDALTDVLAEMYVGKEDLQGPDQMFPLDHLAGGLGRIHLPRLQPDITERTPTVKLDCGLDHGVFRRMRIWLYARDWEVNEKLTKIGCGTIFGTEARSCSVTLDDQTLPGSIGPRDIAITK